MRERAANAGCDRAPAIGRVRTHAYTLLELLLVIVMMGIASALVIPSMGSTNVLRVQSSVRSIVSDISYAQSDAVARQGGRAMVFDVTNNKYSIVEVHGATLNPSVDTILTTNLADQSRYYDSHLTSAAFDGGSNILVFDEMGGPVTGPGSSTPGNGGRITISGSGSVFNIDIEPYTGRVTVSRISGP